MDAIEIPVLFIIFNRKEVSQKVFNQIRKVRPRHLYIAADGPRPGHADDFIKCQQTRDIIKQIDWDCELKTCFRTENLGCGKGVVTAISWFFQQVEQGIILEDDVFPYLDFFYYCEELLEKYKNDSRVALISGNTFYKKGFGEMSYNFSCYPHTWGWATWRRTWENFDMFLENYTLADFKKALEWCDFCWNDRQMQSDRFKIMKKGGTDGWDWQFMFHVWRLKELTIIPKIPLIQNIGFGMDATHFKVSGRNTDFIKDEVSIRPLVHPVQVERNPSLDHNYNSTVEVVIPCFHRLIKIRKSILWWTWRWIRRQLLVKSKLKK